MAFSTYQSTPSQLVSRNLWRTMNMLWKCPPSKEGILCLSVHSEELALKTRRICRSTPLPSLCGSSHQLLPSKPIILQQWSHKGTNQDNIGVTERIWIGTQIPEIRKKYWEGEHWPGRYLGNQPNKGTQGMNELGIKIRRMIMDSVDE